MAKPPADDDASERFDSQHFDSLMNLLTGFGIADKDRVESFDVKPAKRFDSAQATELFRGNHYAARICELPIREALREGFRFRVVDDPDATQEYNDEIDRIKLLPKLLQAGTWARLHGGAAVLLGIDDGNEPSEPVDKDSIQAIKWAQVVDRWSLIANTGDLEDDPESDGWGKPRTYSLHTVGGSNLTIEGHSLIHHSRMLRLHGVKLPDDAKAENDYWGDSVLVRAFDAITNHWTVEHGLGNLVQTFNQTIFKMSGLKQMATSKKGVEQLQMRMLMLNMSRSILGMLLCDSEDEDFVNRTVSLQGVVGIYDKTAHSLAAAAQMPVTLLFGQTPSGMSTDDESGARNQENMVKDVQTSMLVPAISKYLDLFAAMRGQDETFVIEPNALRQLTDVEKSEVRKATAETDAINIQWGIYTPSEVRQSRYSGGEFQLDLVLEKDDDDVGEEPFEIPSPPSPSEEVETQDIRDFLRRVLDADPNDMLPEKVGQQEVGYVAESRGRETCDRCAWFEAPDGCGIVHGLIDGGGWCPLWGTKAFANGE